MTGDFRASGTVNVELGGAQAGGYDQIKVGGKADLAGTLNITALGGFDKTGTARFNILTAASPPGTFSSVTGLGIRNPALEVDAGTTSFDLK